MRTEDQICTEVSEFLQAASIKKFKVKAEPTDPGEDPQVCFVVDVAPDDKVRVEKLLQEYGKVAFRIQENWTMQPPILRDCPACGKQLTREWDGEYEIVRCPKDGFQYPVHPTMVDPYRLEQFKEFCRMKPHNRGVARELVYTPGQWMNFADEFLRECPENPDEDWRDRF